MRMKKAIQAQFSRCQTGFGRSSCSPISTCSRFLPNSAWLTHSASAIAQSSALGFHLMKVGSWNQMVAPPRTAISPNVTQSIVSTLRAHQHQEADLHHRRDHDDDRREQDRRLVDADDAAGDREAEVLGRIASRGLGVHVGELEDAEEQDDRQEVEEQLH